MTKSGDRFGLPMAAVAYVLAVAMIGTTLQTPLYPIYERALGFGSFIETVVFAIYAVGVLVTLILFGRTSDSVGRKPMLLAAVVFAGLAAATFIAVSFLSGAAGIGVLLFGRCLSGLSGGLAAGCAAAALTDLAPSGARDRASLVATMAQMGGLGLGPLLGGFFAAGFSDPIRAVFVAYLVLVLVAAFAVTSIPKTVTRHGRISFARVVTPIRIRAVREQANVTGLTGFMGFAVLGLFSSVSPALLERMGWHSPIAAGVIVCSVFAASALGQLLTMDLPTRLARLFGLGALMVGVLVVGAGMRAESIPLLVGGGLVCGVGQGMSFKAALATVTSRAPSVRLGEATAGFFLICYLGISVPVLGIGALSGLVGLEGAGEIFALVTVLLSVFALVVTGVRGTGSAHHHHVTS